MARTHPESIIQMQIVNWVKQKTDLPIMRIKNESEASFFMRSIDKKMGLLPGAFDLFLPRSNGKQSGLWLEVKTTKGKLSEHQLSFMELMTQEGYAAIACWSFEAAIEIIRAFYNILPDFPEAA